MHSMTIEWDDVRVFQAAIRAGDYTTAGRRLGLNRTTIGRRIARLESSIGLALWEVTPHGHRPTEHGQKVARAARAMERAMERLATELHLNQPVGPIRLASTTGIAELLFSVISDFRKANPGVSVALTGARDAIEAINQRHADLGLAIAQNKPRDLEGQRIGRIHQALYTKRGSEVNGRIGWGHAMMLANPQPWSRINEPAGAELVCEVDSAGAMLEAVRKGIGAAWLWTFLGDAEPDLVRLDAKPPHAASAALWLVYRQDVAMDAPVAALRDMLHSVLAPLLE